MTTTTEQQPAAVAPATAAAPAKQREPASNSRPSPTRIPVGEVALILGLLFISGSMFATEPLSAHFGETGGWIAYAAIVAAIAIAAILILRGRLLNARRRGGGGGRSGPGLFGGRGSGGGGGRSGLGRLLPGSGRRRNASSPSATGPSSGRKQGPLARLRNALPKGVPGSTKGKQPKGSTAGGGSGQVGKGSPTGRGRSGSAGGRRATGNGQGGGDHVKKGPVGRWQDRRADKKAAKKDAKARADKARDKAELKDQRRWEAEEAKDRAAAKAEQETGRRRPSPRPEATTQQGTTRKGGDSPMGGTARPASSGGQDNFGRDGDEYSSVAWLLKAIPAAARSVTPRRERITHVTRQARDVYKVPEPVQAKLDRMSTNARRLEELASSLPAMGRAMHAPDIRDYEEPVNGSQEQQATRDVDPYLRGGGS